MSNVKLYQPVAEEGAWDEPAPVIFRIEDYAALRPRRTPPTETFDEEDETVGRARILHMNRRCPYCKHPVVQPLELNDGRYNRNRSRLPGSASVVGFQCDGCYQEWPA